LVLINKAQEPAIAAMTPFTPLQAPMVDLGPGSTVQLVARMSRENPYRLDDRPIGVWDGYVVVHTKPWIPPNYIVIMIVGSTAGKVLTFRTRNVPGYGTLRMVAEHEHYPLRAQHMEREFGVGVWQRLGAAVLYAGGSSYVAPVIP
jgi:hypothetical protein